MRKWIDTLKASNPKLFASLKVALIAFLVDFIPDLLGFVGDVREWASGAPDEFPALAPIWKACISAATGAAAGLLLYLYNTIRPASAPVYVDPPAVVIEADDPGNPRVID